MIHNWPTFIAATHQSLAVVRNGAAQDIHTSGQRYYGVSWSDDRIFIAHSPPDTMKPQVRILDKELKDIGAVPGSYPGVHQILFSSGKLYITVTDYNRVDIWDGSVIVPVNWTEHITDINHINSFAFTGGAFWACHLNFVAQGKHETSELVCLRPDMSVSRKIPVGNDIHNVFVDGGSIYTLSSSDGDLLVIDKYTGVERRRVHIGAWVRGLAVTDRYILIGASPVAARPTRADGKSEVYLLGRDSLCILDVLCMNSPINELRVIHEPDYAHNEYLFPTGDL